MALGNLFDIFSTDNAQKAASDQIAGINAGIGALKTDFGSGRDALTTNYAAALQPFTQNYDAAQKGVMSYGDVMGTNGAEGNARAVQAFWNNPAIQSQLDIGSQNVMRKNAQMGNTASGAALTALQDYGQQTAAQQWQNYVSNLKPYLDYSTAGATGIAGVDTGLGNQLNANYMNQGNAQYGAQTSIGNANANADLAGNTASANMWGAGLGLGKMALAAAPLFGLSDERTKENIEPVGEMADGQTIYRYNYKGGDKTHIGLIAQEVEEVEPEAIGEYKNTGFKAVDYKLATNRAAQLFAMAA